MLKGKVSAQGSLQLNLSLGLRLGLRFGALWGFGKLASVQMGFRPAPVGGILAFNGVTALGS